MKVVALLLVTLCSLSSFAGPVEFKSNSELPPSVKSVIAQTISAQCPYIANKEWPVVESRTETYANPPDTMTPDLHYRTVFTVMAEDNDGMHPYTFQMVVETVNDQVLTIDARDACRYSAE